MKNHPSPSPDRHSKFPQPAPLVGILGALAVAFNWAIPAAQAGDPFRSTNPSPMGDHIEMAFDAMFEQGNYVEASRHLAQAETTEGDEPLVYAMLGALAYLDQDWADLNRYADETLTKGSALVAQDPLRGNLYRAIGHFLEGAYVLSPAGEGTLRGLPTVLNKLQEVYAALGEAQKVNPNDPELNLIQGFMDLQVAVNLPLASPKKAVQRLEGAAAPRFIADWGIALAYRDLNRLPEALDRVNAALNASGQQNPQLYHLRAQILRKQAEQGNSALFAQAQADFETALAKANQLPKVVVGDIAREYCRNQIQVDQVERDCSTVRQKIMQVSGTWGPTLTPQGGDVVVVSPTAEDGGV
jgi:tetratricopeptide (TPR) repeat protein